MRRLPFCLLSLMLIGLYPSAFLAAEEPQSTATSEHALLVVMAPAGPLLVEMTISVDGKPYRLWVTTFLAQRVDLDRNGTLTAAELALIPDRLLQQTTARSAAQALQLSTEHSGSHNDVTDTVAVPVFAQWFSAQLSQSFNMIAGAVQPFEAVRLASLIDANGDGRVSRTELVSGGQALRFRDLDDDQTFTAAELMPFRDPRNQQAPIVPDVANLPFVQLSDDDSFNRTVAQILRRYGNEGGVSVDALRVPNDSVSGIDRDHDGTLNESEIHTFLTAGIAHLGMDVQLSDRANRSQLVVRIPSTSAGFCSATEGRRGRYQLLLDDMPIEVRCRGGSKDSRGFLVNFLLQRMAAYDEDKNGYLSEDEFPQLQQQMATQLQVAGNYADVDLNSDGMLLRDEVKLYIERDAVATQSRIDVSVKQDGKTLFKLLDQNSDRRLTERELREGYGTLADYDTDGDEHFTESELGTAYVLTIGLGQAESLRMDSMQSMSMQARSADAILPGVAGLDGPEWFRRMDRNQDRDVSYREFLGNRKTFEQLDTDQDGLLSAAEAERLQP